MAVVDTGGKRGHFIPTTTTITAEGTANNYFREIFRLHGLPEKIVSDRGPQFVAKFMREMARLLGIQLAHSTAYHPQTDGNTERVNQEIEQYIRLFVSHHQDDWDELLPMFEFAYNNHVHASTQHTPFMLDTGRNPRMGFEPLPPSRVESANEFRQRMESSWEEARAAIVKAKEDYTRYYNRRRTPAPEFKAGDRVYLDAEDINTDRQTKKFDALRYGPFEVLERIGSAAYRLRLPRSMVKLHPVFPVIKLTPAPDDPIPGRRAASPPPPEVIDGELEYLVEKILNSRPRGNHVEYLVKWVGYPASHNSWEPDDSVFADDKVKEFSERYPNKPCHLINAISASATSPPKLNSIFRVPATFLKSPAFRPINQKDWAGSARIALSTPIHWELH
jgi:hypothetical protein